MILGDADDVRYEHALELFRAEGGGKMSDLHGLAESRLAIIPGITHIGMIQPTDWLKPRLLIPSIPTLIQRLRLFKNAA